MSHVAYLARFTVVSLAVLAMSVLAIGCPQPEPEDPGDVEDDESEDIVLDEYEPLEIGGDVHQPQGMIQPPDINITGAEREQTWNEGNELYRENDVEGALETYESLVEMNPDDVPEDVEIWMGYLYLRQHQNDEAAEIAEAYALPEAEEEEEEGEADEGDEGDEGGGNEIELRGHQAYVAAWSAFRQGEYEQARDFIAFAGKRWPTPEGQRAVVDDIVLMTARAGTPVADAHALVEDVVGEDVEQQFVLLFRVHEQYVLAGEFQMASEMLDFIADDLLGEDGLPDADAVGFRYRQSDYQFRLGNPAEAAQFAIDSYDNLEACGEECEGDTAEEVTRRLADLGRIFHTVYATSLDETFYEPAISLYEAYVEIDDREDTEEVAEFMENLEQTREHMPADQGTHDAQVMSNVINARSESIQACYEEALGWEPDLAGDLDTTIEVEDTGDVTEVSAEAGGEEAAEEFDTVASCVEDRVAEWSFPARSHPGTTTIEQVFSLTTEIAPVDEAPAEGPGEASAPQPDAGEREG